MVYLFYGGHRPADSTPLQYALSISIYWILLDMKYRSSIYKIISVYRNYIVHITLNSCHYLFHGKLKIEVHQSSHCDLSTVDRGPNFSLFEKSAPPKISTGGSSFPYLNCRIWIHLVYPVYPIFRHPNHCRWIQVRRLWLTWTRTTRDPKETTDPGASMRATGAAWKDILRTWDDWDDDGDMVKYGNIDSTKL